MARLYVTMSCGVLALSLTAGIHLVSAEDESQVPSPSYFRDVRPILQAHCVGCHQPAKASSELVLDRCSGILAGGSSGKVIQPGAPDDSELIEQITPIDGEASMPPEGPPLNGDAIHTLRRWITAGAVDDTPASVDSPFDSEHPPRYTRLPPVTSLDFSPDGQLIAVAGFHEVLLHRADGSGVVGRLIGLSERIERVRFSPDGKRLAVAGGKPARLGELQIWDVDRRELQLSVPVGFDTIYGASWSPDGKLVAFGTPDNLLLAIDAQTGQQQLQMRSHTDWVLDTAFSAQGDHLVSAGRDMTAKLTRVATQQFVDNITSITPGALKGGIHCLAMHPRRDEVLIGGVDGIPQILRLYRETDRKIGDNANLVRRLPAVTGRIWSVAFDSSGTKVATASGLDGHGSVSIYDCHYDPAIPDLVRTAFDKVADGRSPEEREAVEAFHTQGVERLQTVDVPQGEVYAVAFQPDGPLLAAAGADGLVRLIRSDNGQVVREFPAVPIDAEDHLLAQSHPTDAATGQTPDFVRDVSPILSRLGCNAGTCHGAKDGKNGFKLSLRGYDPVFDLRALTGDHASRRVNIASPDHSLMLLKATGTVPHGGGVVTELDSEYYRKVRAWIAAGARLDPRSERPRRIQITPTNPVLASEGETQSFQVVCQYADGTTRDVTRESFIESGNTEVATHDHAGTITAIRRGEAPILARYEGCYAATTLTVMGDRDGFEWSEPETWGTIDELIAGKWKRLKIQPSGLCSDTEFLRRVHLDLTGLPPNAAQVTAFLADSRPTRQKRDEVIERLIGSAEFVDYWTNKWSDLLQINSKFLGADGATRFRDWVRSEVDHNTAYDKFVYQIVTATGSNYDHPPASYFKILRTPEALLENTTHLFLATRFNCNKCHDHPFERWTQDQYYQTGAFLAQVALEADAEHSQGKQVGGSAVEGATALYEIVKDRGEGELRHERTHEITPPQFPFPCKFESAPDAPRREQLARWLTSPDNRYFASSYVNRLWGYLLGSGIIEPIDDMRAGNPPTHPELLEYLTRQFVESGFDVRYMLSLICRSRTYQLSIETNRWNQDDTVNFSHARARRLPAEVLLDAVYQVTGTAPNIPGVRSGTRAVQLADAQVDVKSGLLATLGRPARESACECERGSDIHLPAVMGLLNGPEIAEAIANPNTAIAQLVEHESDDAEVIRQVYLRVLGRAPSTKEIRDVQECWAEIPQDHESLVHELARHEAEWTIRRDELARRRLQSIQQAEHDLQQYLPEHQRLLQEAESAQAVRIREAATALENYLQTQIPEHVAQWERQLGLEPLWTRWQPLTATKFEATGGIQLAQQQNGSLLASGNLAATNYTIETLPPDAPITGLLLEALPHDDLPGFGPGLNPNGNFVVSEIELVWRPVGADAPEQNVALSAAQADYNQQDFDVGRAINGKYERDDRGWAVEGAQRRPHRARFQLAEPFRPPGPGTLIVRVFCQYGNGDFPLACFRLWTTDSTRPMAEGIPSDVATLLLAPPEGRTEEQLTQLRTYVADQDAQQLELRQKLAAERRPLPTDTRLVELQQALDKAQLPVLEDPGIVRLRADVEQSAMQLSKHRLTAVQDLTWALINTSEFLFNH